MTSDDSLQDSATPVDEGDSSTGDARAQRPAANKRSATGSVANRRRTKPVRRALIDTTGPTPDAELGNIRLTIGVIGGTHGVQGELKMKLLTDHPEHIPALSQVYLGDSDTPTALQGFRFQGDQALIQLEGVTTPEAGKLLGGLKVRIAGSDAKPLEEGEYFLFQLIGLQAVTADGTAIGTVSDLIETGAHDVLVITPEQGADILVPNHPQFVREIHPDLNRIVVDPPVYAS